MSKTVSAQSFIIEIEQNVLGSCLLETESFVKCSPILTADNFVEPIHQEIFLNIEKAYDTYKSTTLPIVIRFVTAEQDIALKQKAGIGLKEYVARLTTSAVVTSAGIQDRAKAVVEQWARLRLVEEAENIASAARDPLANAGNLISTAFQSFDQIIQKSRKGITRNSRAMLGAAMEQAFKAAHEARQRGSGLTGITWGLTDLNRLTGGIQRRDLTLIGARPSMGKTTFATSIARAAAKSGKGVGIISLEMDKEKVSARMASDIAYDWNVQVPYIDIIRGNIEKSELDSVISACRDVSRLPIQIDDQAAVTVSEIKAKLEAMIIDAGKAVQDFSVLIIDHLGLVRASNRYSGNRNNEIAEMTAAMKSMAREYDIAVILLSQLNRELEKRSDKRPQLSDLRDSGAIEQDADTIMFLHRDAYYLKRQKGGSFEEQAERTSKLADCENLMEIIVAKQRNGPIETIKVWADMACAAVRNGAGRVYQ